MKAFSSFFFSSFSCFFYFSKREMFGDDGV